jgi:peptide/nickel transport system substrate-binding protein
MIRPNRFSMAALLSRWMCVWLVLAAIADTVAAAPQHAIAMHGEPRWPADFTSAPYVNPNAPKGGRLVQGVVGTFDSLNPFIVKGLALSAVRGYVIESLMARGYDEPFTLYGLIAKSIETDATRNIVTFTLNPAARFSDGKPVTPEDVVFSWALLREHGRPNHRTYYSKVVKAEAIGSDVVRFDLTGSNDRELPLILGLMPVLPKHAIDPEKFEETTLSPLTGSGPYVIGKVEPGRTVSLMRNPDYWGRDLPINRGFWNFGEIRYDFYRDANAYMEAFKRNLFDVRSETDPSRWVKEYDIPALKDGRLIKDVFQTAMPKIYSGLVFNTRRPVFADIRAREAISLLFDFEWVNKNFYFGLYERSASYFHGSELSSAGRPASPRELAMLAPYPGVVREDVLNGTWTPAVSDGSGRDRDNLKKALALLEAAGYELDGAELRNTKTREPFSFELMVTTKEQERIGLAFQRDLKRAGIALRLRVVDAVQFDRRKLTFDFDMIENRWDQSLSPGNEQLFYWSSASADSDGTRNYMGVKSKAIDALIAKMLEATEREDFVATVRALDRVLVSGFYCVPLFHLPQQWVARWSHIEHPATTPAIGYLPETWWRKP